MEGLGVRFATPSKRPDIGDGRGTALRFRSARVPQDKTCGRIDTLNMLS